MAAHPPNLVVMGAASQPSDLAKRILQAQALVVVDFFAPWCGPCQRLGQELPKIAEDNKNVQFIKVNVDECNEIAEQFQVSSIPHLSFLKGKGDKIEELGRVVGMNIPAIKQNITKWS